MVYPSGIPVTLPSESTDTGEVPIIASLSGSKNPASIISGQESPSLSESKELKVPSLSESKSVIK